jgi:hypothetical protein
MPASYRIHTPSTDYEPYLEESTMLPFIFGTMIGSIAMLFVMSLMIASKQADQRSEMMFNK